jgi:amino acid adenylation domain-containing protein
MQEGMLFHSVSAPGTGVEIEQILCRTTEPLEAAVLAEAWKRVAQRYDALRTRFRWEGIPAPIQEVVSEFDIALEIEPSDRSVEELMAADRNRDFDLSESTMRIRVVPGAAGWTMLWSFHHAILDGRSFPIVLRELFDCYRALLRGAEWSPEPVAAPFSTFADHVATRPREGSRPFWEQLLRGHAAQDHPLVQRRSPVNSGDFGGVEQRLVVAEADAVRAFASRDGLTMNTMLQAAWSITMLNHTRSADSVFGGTRACRHVAVPGVVGMVGLLINTVPVRANAGASTVGDLLRDLRRQWVSQREHELTPLTSIQEWSGTPGPLFDSIVVFDGAELRDTLRSNGNEWLDRDFEYRGRTGYPLTLIGYDGPEPLIRLEYDRALVADDLAKQLLDETVRAIGALPSSVDVAPAAVPVLSPGDRKRVLQLAVPRREYSTEMTSIPARVIAAAAETPDALAVCGAGMSLTYRQLDEMSACIAGGLRARGVSAGARVGVMLERTPRATAVMLGVMRAGGCYVPLDPDSPAERVRFLAEDAGLAAIICDRDMSQLPNVPSVVVDALLAGPVETVDPDPENAAYIIYTSGSTGRPKGVVVTHANVTRLLDSCLELFDFHATDVWSCFHSFAFDFSVWEIWCALMTGARTVIATRDEIVSPDLFADLLEREQVTVLSQTPSAFRQLQSEIVTRKNAALRLRYVVFGGEALDAMALRPWIDAFGDRSPALINMYGITETTVHVTFRQILAEDAGRTGSPIGEPLPDLGVLLLNAGGGLAPVGAPGEMYISGGGVSDGYLNRAELTAERFVEIAHVPGRRFYRSGDVARLRADGGLVFLGRSDSQVKVRGHRIEPGEIEEALRRHPAIRDVRVVQKRSGSDTELAAYLIPKGEAPVPSELREHLGVTLPPYMVPKWFVPVASIPLTANGKIDTEALPDPESVRDATVAYVPPAGGLEESIAGVWCEILKLERVGIRDNFFDLGGNSLLLVRVAGRLREVLARPVEVIRLFEYPTVEALARHLAPSDSDDTGRYAEIAARAARQRRNFLTARKS